MRRSRFWILGALALLAAALPALAAPDLVPLLDRYYDDWLVSVDALITDAERRAFLGLRGDVERELFLRRFWAARGDGGVALARWKLSFEEARRRFRNLAGDRAQALMVAGKPSHVLAFGGCGLDVRQIEVWSYSDQQARHLAGRDDLRGFHLVFYQPSRRRTGELRQWSRSEGYSVLMVGRREASLVDLMAAGSSNSCVPATYSEIREIRAALPEAWGAEALRRYLPAPAPDPGWLDGPPHETSLPGSLAVSYPSHSRRHYTIVRGRVTIPTAAVGRNGDGLLFDRLVLVGDIYQEGILVDAFRVVHHVAGRPPGPRKEDGTVELDFYRRLNRGRYSLSLRLEGGDGLALLREERRLDVPWVEAEVEPPAGFRLGYDGLVRDEVGILTTFPSVRLEVAADEALAGDVEVAAVTTGGPIGRIDFLLDGETTASDAEPPYAAVLALATAPERRTLTARAFAPDGRELARDEVILNAAPPRFAVRLAEPRRGAPSERVAARVDVPLDERLARLDLYLGEERFATLFEPPFVHPLPPERPRRDAFVRAVAYLESGAKAEDIVFLSDEPLEEVDVDLVELYTSVLGTDGRPVLGLARESFQIFEDGEEQPIHRFDTVENLPIHVVLLMDVSKSMRHRMAIATESAHRFFEGVLTPKDQAAVLVFNHDILLAVPFTNDVKRLRYATSGLSSWGSTRLHDSLVYALHSFGGQVGKKALVLLSDGQDVDSDFYFRQVLEFALRSGVAAYPIVLDLPHEETRANLERLAEQTGGRFFSISVPSALGRVYRQIEQDLRSQYLLLYRPPTGKPRTEFRQVEVKVPGAGWKARTIHGYYP